MKPKTPHSNITTHTPIPIQLVDLNISMSLDIEAKVRPCVRDSDFTESYYTQT